MIHTHSIVPTYTAHIYVGRRVHYSGEVLPLTIAQDTIQSYCNEISLCVTLTETEFIYKDGGEPGFIVGLINYPRFPSTERELQDKALALAECLLNAYQQFRVTVVFPDDTVMLIGDDQ